jgi:hypothetical protein
MRLDLLKTRTRPGLERLVSLAVAFLLFGTDDAREAVFRRRPPALAAIR